MTILYLIDSTTVSGAEIVVLGYIDAVRARGDNAVAFVSASNPRLIAALEALQVPCKVSTAFSRELIRTTLRPAALREFGRSFARVRQELRTFIRQHEVDVLHSLSYPASLYGALALPIDGVAHIWHEHNIKRVHRVNRIIYRFVGGTCRAVVGPSDAVTGNLARAGIDGRRLRTIYNGIDLDRFRPADVEESAGLRRALGLSDGAQAVGLFGQMLPYKGHRTLIQAAPSILAACPNVDFFFVGALENPPYQQELQTEIARCGLGGRIHFTGWQPDVHKTMQAMDVIVVGTTTPEPAALSLMESMAVGRSLVATRTGGTPEIVVDGVTGLLFEPGDAAGLAERVVRLLTDSRLAQSLGCAGRAHVEARFGRPQHIGAMLSLYGVAGQPSSVR